MWHGANRLQMAISYLDETLEPASIYTFAKT